MNLLESLGEKYDPTKRFHNYLKHYSTHFQERRLEFKKVLEIGVQTDSSVKMWREYFPNAQIYGLDLDPACKAFEDDRISIFIGDQSDPDVLNNIIQQTGGGFDVVIDDGSHIQEHQIKTFNHLFPALDEFGIYVIEDVIEQDHAVTKTLMQLVLDVNYWPPGFDSTRNEDYGKQFSAEATWTQHNVVGLAFYRYLIFLFRGRNPDGNPYYKPFMK